MLSCLQRSQGQPADIACFCTCCLEARAVLCSPSPTSSEIEEQLQQGKHAVLPLLVGILICVLHKNQAKRDSRQVGHGASFIDFPRPSTRLRNVKCKKRREQIQTSSDVGSTNVSMQSGSKLAFRTLDCKIGYGLPRVQLEVLESKH